MDPNQSIASDEIVSAALSGLDGAGTWVDYRGEQVDGVYRWIAPLNMSVVVKQDVTEIQSSTRALSNGLIILGLVFGWIGLLLVLGAVRLVIGEVNRVNETADVISGGHLEQRINDSGLIEVSKLAVSFNRMAERLRQLTDQQEQIIHARTRDLEITARLGHAIASFTALDELLQSTVDMIRDQLGYYHVQVFLLDDLRQQAVLRASMGEAGREMLAHSHKLAVGSRSVVGQATGRSEAVLASDTRHAEFWYPNPLLPQTRAELAIPLRIGEVVIGALDIQAREPDVFDEATISVLQTIADQLAVAIRNAELFEEKEGLLSASLELTQMLTQDSWDEYSQKKGSAPGFRYDLNEVRPVDEMAGDSGYGGDLHLPIALRGAVIGELSAELGEDRHLSEDERQLVGQVLDRVALAIDNARLVEQTQISLQETNRLYHATQEIAASTTIEDLAATLVALGGRETIDRVALLLVETPQLPFDELRGSLARLWVRSDDDPFKNTAEENLLIKDHPLLGKQQDSLTETLVINGEQRETVDESIREYLEQSGTRSLGLFPLVTGRSILGWLILHSTGSDRAFDEDDVRFYESIADQAATALQGIRLFEQTQVRARRLQATNEVSRAASSILNPDILLPIVVDRISEAFEYYHTQIFLIDDMGEWAVLRASTGEVGQELLRRGHRLAVGSRSVIGQVTQTGETIIARETDADSIHRRHELLPDTQAEMALPLKTGDRVIGALDVQSTDAAAFDTEAQAILQSLADQIAVTLENAQLFQEIQDRVAELTTVNLVSQTVSRAQTLEQLYDVVSEQLQRQFGARHAILGVLDENELLHLPIFIEAGERIAPPPPQPIGSGISGHVIRSKEVLLLNENTEDEARRLGARVAGMMPRSVLIVPMMIGEEVIGIISIQDADNEHAYDEAHVRQLTTLAAYIAVKIRNAQLLEEAERRADELGFLFDVTRAAVQTADLDEALGNVAEILLREISGAESAVFYLADELTPTFAAHAAVGYRRELVARQAHIADDEGLVGLAVRDGQPLIIGDTQAPPYSLNGDSQTHGALVLPLQTREEFIGVLTVESTQADIFTPGDLQLLDAASSTLLAVIQNARLLERITQANEQLRELDKLKSQFLANMSHELRTPLNSIIGFSRVMLKGIDGPLNDIQEQDLNTIYNSGQHLLSLINNILDLSKIEAGKMEIQPEYTPLEEIIDSVIAAGRGLVKDSPIEIYKELEENLPEVYGDPVRIRQILLNLMSNAAKFTKEGSITVRATRLARDEESGAPPRVQIDVVDSGIGISDDDMDKLFEPFSQVDGTTTRQVGGTGLGLTITREFIELMGGQIWVESTVGSGSTFSFTVPLHPAESEAAQVVVETDRTGERPVVLAVDDEPGVLDLYARYLEKEGYAVVGINNANDILDFVRDYHPAAIVLDLNMPGKSGWDAIRDLRAAADTAGVPIIICSIDEDRERGESVGVAEYLVKPVIEDDLLRSLGRVLNGAVAGLTDVVVIDQDEAFALQTSAALTSAYGCHVRTYTTGYEGLAGLEEHRPDVLIMDLDLPDMDGYGLLVSMRTQDELADLPVIILTARELSADQIERLDESTTHLVVKSTGDTTLVADLPSVLQTLGK